MGKKRIIQKSQETLIAEREAVEEAIRKQATQTPQQPQKIKTREGVVRILATYNNTIISLTDKNGNVLASSSAGAIGFTGTKKSTPFAAARVAEALTEKAKKLGIDRVEVFVKGIGSGRESAIRSLATHGFELMRIKDITPIPHNGPRPPKPRRV